MIIVTILFIGIFIWIFVWKKLVSVVGLLPGNEFGASDDVSPSRANQGTGLEEVHQGDVGEDQLHDLVW